MHLIQSSAPYILLTLLTNVTVYAYSMDADQTAPIGAVLSRSTLFDLKSC